MNTYNGQLGARRASESDNEEWSRSTSMKRIALLLLLLPSVALAHEDGECPICTCTLIQRDPTWRDQHDAWWNTYHEIQRLIGDYARCVGALNELEAVLKRPFTPANSVILNYEQNIQHPLEDRPNDTTFAQFELEASRVTLGQFLGETLACSHGVDLLRAEVARRVKLRKR